MQHNNICNTTNHSCKKRPNSIVLLHFSIVGSFRSVRVK